MSSVLSVQQTEPKWSQTRLTSRMGQRRCSRYSFIDRPPLNVLREEIRFNGKSMETMLFTSAKSRRNAAFLPQRHHIVPTLRSRSLEVRSADSQDWPNCSRSSRRCHRHSRERTKVAEPHLAIMPHQAQCTSSMLFLTHNKAALSPVH